ncbi:hypothetical protein [Prevotella merdae]|jgi:hypothetical protein|uniref:hypothetical protein n=1 Tax=Prevotella merdae TaxID=2079531 RepID=UPI003566DE1D
MKKVLNPNFQAGSTRCNEPRPIGDILAEMLSSDSPLANSRRKLLTYKPNLAQKGGQA